MTADEKKIGQILCETTDLTEEQLEHGLRTQEKSKNEQLGHILFMLGYITPIQLDKALAVQELMELNRRV